MAMDREVSLAWETSETCESRFWRSRFHKDAWNNEEFEVFVGSLWLKFWGGAQHADLGT